MTKSVKAIAGIRLKQKNSTDKAIQSSKLGMGILKMLTTQVYWSIKMQYFKKENKTNCALSLLCICSMVNFFNQPVKLPGWKYIKKAAAAIIGATHVNQGKNGRL